MCIRDRASIIRHLGDTDTFIGFPSADTFRIVTGNTEALRVDSSQRVGIGTNSPSSLLTVEGDIRQTSGDFLYSGGGNWDIKHLADDQNIVFYTSESGSATEKMRIKANGAIGIGTSSPSASHKLTVGGDTKLTGQLSMSDSQLIKMGDGEDFAFYHDQSIGNIIKSSTSDMDLFIQGNDGGSTITALSFDMSEAGTATFNNGVVVGGDLTVQGTTVTLNTATLDVEDKNITLNAGSGDTSGSADRAGITIQDAVDASTDASLTWRASDDKFIFSHPLRMFGNLELPDSVKLIILACIPVDSGIADTLPKLPTPT